MIDRFAMWCMEIGARLRNPAIVYEPIRTYSIPIWQALAILNAAGAHLQAGGSFEALYLAITRDAPKHDQAPMALRPVQQERPTPSKKQYIGK